MSTNPESAAEAIEGGAACLAPARAANEPADTLLGDAHGRQAGGNAVAKAWLWLVPAVLVTITDGIWRRMVQPREHGGR